MKKKIKGIYKKSFKKKLNFKEVCRLEIILQTDGKEQN